MVNVNFKLDYLLFVRFVVHGLIPGDTYVFRVQAVNTYGLSEESQESDPLFIDAALGMYLKLDYITNNSTSLLKR